MNTKIALLSIIIFFIVFPVSAQLNEVKILAGNGAAGDWFGSSVCIDGDFLIVGAPEYQGGTGIAYIFYRNGSNWLQQATLMANDGNSDDEFGCSVSISSEYAVIGAHQDSDNGIYSGSAYIFKNNSGSWVQQAKLLPSDGFEFEEFGYSVSISGDYAIIGALYDNDRGTSSGSAYIFQRSDTNWIPVTKLIASDGAPLAFFGNSVDISGDYAIIGSPGWKGSYSTSLGAAYIFNRTVNGWVEQDILTASDIDYNARLGYSVSISGNYAIAGRPNDDENGPSSGAVYVFRKEGSVWVQDAKIKPYDNDADDIFGWSVSMSGTVLCASASGKNNNGDFSGAAYVFSRSVNGWIQQSKLLASDGAFNDSFGESVSISGSYCIVGSYWDDNSNGTNAGSAYIYSNFITGVENEQVETLEGFSLLQNYPNPFNPSTKISFSIPGLSFVTLKVYDVVGNEITTLVNEEKLEGVYEVEFNATELSSGIYFYKLKSGNFVETKEFETGNLTY